MYRLMIADDEESIRNGIARSLPWQEWGYEICGLCADGQQVLDKLEECRPDVVLSDIRMPGMDGVELMQRLSSQHPEIKIVVLSGYSDFEYLNMSIRSRVAEYLLKPTDIDDFEDTFRRLKAALDHERVKNIRLTESVLRHFQSWLSDLLGGTALPEESERFMPMLTEQGIDLDNCVVAAYALDGRGGEEKGALAPLWHQVLRLAQESPEGALHRVFFLYQGEGLVGLYSAETEIPARQVLEEVRALQSQVRQQLPVTLSAGVSNLCTEPQMLPQAYEQADCCVKQSLFAGAESVYHFSQMAEERPSELDYFDTERVERALLAQDYESLREEIDRILGQMTAAHCSYQVVDRVCLSLLFHISVWGLRYGVQMDQVLRTLGAHYADIHQCLALSSKRDFVLACLFGCQRELAQRRRTGHASNSVAMRVREYLDAEYCSNALSLESVAAYVHKTPAYISRVFKNELGCNFSDYLAEKRMHRAAELLREPECRVYAVAEQCGYADASSFIRMFKRFYGVSPAEWRTVQGAEG